MYNVYTDGSTLASGSGPSGYGCVILLGEARHEISEGFKMSTNNRMELLGPIVVLEGIIDPSVVSITTDSQYVKNGIEKWVFGWIRNGWKTQEGLPVKNSDLWKRLYEVTRIHKVEWHWVKGHSGDPNNERCDELAKEAAKLDATRTDDGFFQQPNTSSYNKPKFNPWWKKRK